MSIPASGRPRSLGLTLAVKELSPNSGSVGASATSRRFCKKFDVLQIIGLTGRPKDTETPTDINESVVSYVPLLRAELRRGSFARFVVMLGGVKTKDVLTLT